MSYYFMLCAPIMYIRHDSFNQVFWGRENDSDVCCIPYRAVALGIISLQEIVILDANFKDVQLFHLVLYEYCKLAGLRRDRKSVV